MAGGVEGSDASEQVDFNLTGFIFEMILPEFYNPVDIIMNEDEDS